MANDIEKLKSDYRSIRAPAYLATRIRAEAQARARPWTLYVLASVTSVLCIVWFSHVMRSPGPPGEERLDAGVPSLAVLTRLIPDKPVLPAPGLSRIRSVSLPALPGKPVAEQTADLPDNSRTGAGHTKEIDHAYI